MSERTWVGRIAAVALLLAALFAAGCGKSANQEVKERLAESAIALDVVQLEGLCLGTNTPAEADAAADDLIATARDLPGYVYTDESGDRTMAQVLSDAALAVSGCGAVKLAERLDRARETLP